MPVADASVLASALGDDGADGDLARARLRGEVLAAPDLAQLEVVSVLRKQVPLGAMDLRRARLRSPIWQTCRYSAPRICRCCRALGAARQPAYDALAELLDATLVTADASLAGAPGPACAIELLRP